MGKAVDRLAEAEPVLRETLEKKRRVRGVDHPDTLTSINNYGVVLEAMGRPAEAQTHYRDAMEKCRRVLGPEHPNTFITTINTGGALQALGKNADAEKTLDGVEPAALFVSSRGESHKETREGVQALVDLYKARQAAEPGRGWDLKAASWAAKLRLSSSEG